MTYDEYSGAVLNMDTGPAALARATRDVDVLTFGRIRTVELSDFALTRVREVIAALAEWQVQNMDVVDTPYASYSINGVSYTVGGGSVSTIQGVTIPASLYSYLAQTGLCYRGGL